MAEVVSKGIFPFEHRPHPPTPGGEEERPLATPPTNEKSGGMLGFIAATHLGFSRSSAMLSRRAKMSAPIGAPALITFDFTGTLFEPRSSVGVLYRSVLCAEAVRESAACSEAAASLSVEALDTAFRSAYAAATGANPCFGAGSISSEEWWRGVVEATIAGAAGPGVYPALAPAVPSAFDELFGNTFVSAQGWRPLPQALESLQALSAWRAAQPAARRPRVGVISNWDERCAAAASSPTPLHLCASAAVGWRAVCLHRRTARPPRRRTLAHCYTPPQVTAAARRARRREAL